MGKPLAAGEAAEPLQAIADAVFFIVRHLMYISTIVG